MSNDVLIATLENKYAEVDKKTWRSLDLISLRQKEKFSESFLLEASKIMVEFRDFKKSKPKFAVALANECSKEQIPNEIIDAFERLRSRIGISNSTID